MLPFIFFLLAFFFVLPPSAVISDRLIVLLQTRRLMLGNYPPGMRRNLLFAVVANMAGAYPGTLTFEIFLVIGVIAVILTLVQWVSFALFLTMIRISGHA